MIRLSRYWKLQPLCQRTCSSYGIGNNGRLIVLRKDYIGIRKEHSMLKHVAQPSLPELVSDINHYLRTTEMADNLRRKLLRAKCDELLVYGRREGLSTEYFQALKRIFMHARHEKKDMFSGDQLHELFNSAMKFYHGRTTMPQFIHLLASDLAKHPDQFCHYPTMSVVNLVRLGARLQDFSTSLVHSTRYPLADDFVGQLLKVMKANSELRLDVFQALLGAGCVNDDLAGCFVQYVEDLFNDRNPEIHEYLDQERNVARIQEVMNRVIAHDYSAEATVALLVLKSSMNTVSCGVQDLHSVDRLVQRFVQCASGANLDEANCGAVLLEVLKRLGQHAQFLRHLCADISSGHHSDETKAMASITRSLAEATENGAAPQALGVSLKDILLSCADVQPVFAFTLQAVIGVQEEDLVGTFRHLHSMMHQEFSLDAYQHLIGRLLTVDTLQAWEMFDESTSTINWRDSVDPSVPYTLNRLICAVARDESILLEEMFRRFKKIKQNHPSVCDADALSALVERMLDDQCVGDVIELLKRELPNIDKDSVAKIRVEESYCHAHLRLFRLLHNFVLTYENEKTFEVNWVLYGELHKYFQIPHETYLPTMQFFCQRNRLNAALLICRRMKMLSELHGAANANLPPLRDIYMYLFEVFGDGLYEEGVAEVHEYLKMDTALDSQDTELQNSLLNAYSNLQDIGKAHDLFLLMSANSKASGGVNERTAQIMLKTFTYSDMAHVRRFWSQLSEYGVFPNHDLFRQYLIAHSYYGLVDQAIDLASQADDYNLEVSLDMMLAMHNYCLDGAKQQQVAKWASETYPDEWRRLQDSGLLVAASGYMPENFLLEGLNEP